MKAGLDEAVRALREESARDGGGAEFTRARVMASLHQGRVKRRTRLALLLPIAATFVATSAWGVSSGRASVWLEELRVTFGLTEAGGAPAVSASASPRAPGVRRAAPPVAPASDEKAIELPIAEPEAPSQAEQPTAGTLPPASSAALDAELELYKKAHRLHFGGAEPAVALAAWDAYLAASPRGHFALEARYNRALCLVRLDRRVEARAALEPFARGAFAGYRKRESAELLDALAH